MPIKQVVVKAGKFLSYLGVSVYHVYENDDVDNDTVTYRFVLRPYDLAFESFDVRDLPEWVDEEHPPFLIGENDTVENKLLWHAWHERRILEKHVKKVLRAAIKNGTIS